MSDSHGYFALGRWVDDVRALHDELSDDEKTELGNVDGWSWDRTARRTRIDANDYDYWLSRLKDHIRENGSLESLHHSTQEYQWMRRRCEEKRRGDLLTQRETELGLLLGWRWNIQDAKFVAWVERFREHATAFGARGVPPTFVTPDGRKLGAWIARVRKQYVDGTLGPDRFVMLDSLALWRW